MTAAQQAGDAQVFVDLRPMNSLSVAQQLVFLQAGLKPYRKRAADLRFGWNNLSCDCSFLPLEFDNSRKVGGEFFRNSFPREDFDSVNVFLCKGNLINVADN